MDTYSNRFNKIHFSIFSICFIYFLLYTSFYFACFLDKDGLYKLIMANKTYENLPFTLSFDDIKLIASELIQYIKGSLQFLETKVTINGVLTDFYSVRSKIHMGDVRNIIVTLSKAYYVSILFCFISAFKMINFKNFLTMLKNIYYKVILIIASLITIIFIYAATNFDTFFVHFHHVLFTNDLWLLDPREDYIICLLPEKIFMTYGFRIVILMLVLLLSSVFALHILSRIQSRQEAR